jgi:hypothetical protein
MLAMSLSAHDRMYGPAVRRKGFFVDLVGDGSCVKCMRPLVGALLRAIMDISSRAISLGDRPQPSHLSHQCSHTPRRPILHRRLKSSRRPQQARKWLRHQWLFFSLKVPLFPPDAVPSSRPALGQRRRAQRTPHVFAGAFLRSEELF